MTTRDIKDAIAQAKSEEDALIRKGADKPSLKQRVLTGLTAGATMAASWSAISAIVDMFFEAKSGKPLFKRTDWKKVGDELTLLVPLSGIVAATTLPDLTNKTRFEHKIQTVHDHTQQLEKLEHAVDTAIKDPDSLRVLTENATVETLAKTDKEPIRS